MKRDKAGFIMAFEAMLFSTVCIMGNPSRPEGAMMMGIATLLMLFAWWRYHEVGR